MLKHHSEIWENKAKLNYMANISPCGMYRYSLTRSWNEALPRVLFVMLNPSTADAYRDDPTIRRCIGFAKSWGYGRLDVCNIFAYRTTFPNELLHVTDPCGVKNLSTLKRYAVKADKIICAWGNGRLIKRLMPNQSPIQLLDSVKSKLHYLELSKDYTPRHPLYIKSSTLPQHFY